MFMKWTLVIECEVKGKNWNLLITENNVIVRFFWFLFIILHEYKIS